MPKNIMNGFLTDEQRAKFVAAGALYRPGGQLALLCGARGRSGNPCRRIALSGEKRCRLHAGPDAHRRHRQRLIEDVAAGHMSAAEFEALEAKRRANTLRRYWHKNPWAPGQTIDLCEHESAFRAALAVLQLNPATMPPGLADGARWRFRRTCLDRGSPADWSRFLDSMRNLPEKVRAAGPAPAGGPDGLAAAAVVVPIAVSGAPGPFSKRRRADRDQLLGAVRPAHAHRAQTRPMASRVKTKTPEEEIYELDTFLNQHWQDLRPLLQDANTATRRRGAQLHRAVLENPRDAKGWERWVDFVRDVSTGVQYS